MYKQENSEILSFYAISPVHAGAESSMGVVDSPIQRERHTQWPLIHASGVKGSMRHHFEKFKGNVENKDQIKDFENITKLIFGDDKYKGDGEAKSLPGAISISDAKLIAFPVRSNISPFVWITCPAVLKRINSDFKLTGIDEKIKISAVEEYNAVVINDSIEKGKKVLLEDYEVNVVDEKVTLNEKASELFKKAETLLLVNDSVYNYAVSNCTEIQTQIRIDDKTGTAQDGSLRYEELLPADSIMYSVLFYGKTRNSENPLSTENLIKYMKEEVIKNHIQMGGDETLGRGMFEIKWIKGGK